MSKMRRKKAPQQASNGDMVSISFSAIEKRLLGIMEKLAYLKPMPVPEIFEEETDD